MDPEDVPELLPAARLAAVLHGVVEHGRLDTRSRERLEDAITGLLDPNADELRVIVIAAHRQLLQELLLLASRHLATAIEPTDATTETARVVNVVLLDGEIDPSSRRVLQRVRDRLTQ